MCEIAIGIWAFQTLLDIIVVGINSLEACYVSIMSLPKVYSHHLRFCTFWKNLLIVEQNLSSMMLAFLLPTILLRIPYLGLPAIVSWYVGTHKLKVQWIVVCDVGLTHRTVWFGDIRYEVVNIEGVNRFRRFFFLLFFASFDTSRLLWLVIAEQILFVDLP